MAWGSQLLSHRELKEQVKERDKKLLVKVKSAKNFYREGERDKRDFQG